MAQDFLLLPNMSLVQYNKKRRFSQTPEPRGKEKSSKSDLRFVVQKHDASSVHYDFRLEMDGVLKSWAVPKGPSLNPADKRLAMMVEDHPYDYRTFEGVIPQGNYGAGTVIVWDEGVYGPLGGEGLSKREKDKLLLQQWNDGNLKIVLHGKKLNGIFALFRLHKGKGDKSWLLVKKNDDYAGKKDISALTQSVRSGKTLGQVAAAAGVELNHPEEERTPPKPVKKATPEALPKAAARAKRTAKKKNVNVNQLLGDNFILARPGDTPPKAKPMLATLVDDPFDNSGWIYEIKWDGYRALAHCRDGSVELISRNLSSFTQKYYPVTEALQAFGINAVFDGEIVAVDEKELANFQLLQNWQNSPQAHLQFYIFDILWLDGYNITQVPLKARKDLLRQLLPQDHPVLKYSDHIEGAGRNFFRAALKQGLEGIMAKRANSVYEINGRSNNWLKVKANQRQEVIITGFTQPRNSRKFFGALLLGVYDQNNKLIYVGHTGSGFNTESLGQIWKRLQPLVTGECPFEKCPKSNMPATWVRPKLVCEIKFTEWTKGWIARHPIFMGLREDKKPKDVRIEKAKNIAAMVSKAVSKKAGPKKSIAKKAAPKRAASRPAAQKKSPIKTKTSGIQLDLEGGANQTVAINSRQLALTNLDKLYWVKEGTRKIDLLNYYLRIAPYILPYMLGRPQSLHRHPNGISGQHFFQKDVRGKVPDWVQTHTDFSESTNENVDYLVCSNEATLVYMANLGCIELHPWHSRVGSIDNPDYCLIDLDPEGIGFDKVIECAQVARKVIESIGAIGYCKTSGSTGLHIYIPLSARYNYDQSKQLAELIATMVNREIPDYTSLERNPAKRKNKIYLDFLQNRETQTAAAPYSLRPKPGMPVSAPLHWDEVRKGLTPTTFNIHNIFDRVQAEGDLFKPVLGKGINLEKVLQKLESFS